MIENIVEIMGMDIKQLCIVGSGCVTMLASLTHIGDREGIVVAVIGLLITMSGLFLV